MKIDALIAFCLSGPFVAILLILIYFYLARFLHSLPRPKGKKKRRFRPSTVALGMAFQFLQVFYRPSIAYVIEARQEADEDADQDEDGDKETLTKQLHRQLRLIRRGEFVDRLILRL
jgi:hypothetical protein